MAQTSRDAVEQDLNLAPSPNEKPHSALSDTACHSTVEEESITNEKADTASREEHVETSDAISIVQQLPETNATTVMAQSVPDVGGDTFVPPDMEHIVSMGAAQDATASTETLRQLVAKARELTGQVREALPPGFDDQLPLEQPPAPSEDKDAVQKGHMQAVEEYRDAEELPDAVERKEDPDSKSLHEDTTLLSAKTATDTAKSSDADSSSGSDSDSSSSSSSLLEDDDEDEDEDEGQDNVEAGGRTAKVEYDDDEDDAGGVTSSAPATKNEILVPEVNLPLVQELSEEDKATMRPLGRLHSIVDSVVVVEQEVHQMHDADKVSRALPVDSTGRRGESESEYSVVDTGSLLCLEDGKVLGLVFETFGSIYSPMYSIRFPSASAIDKESVQIGKAVFYLPGQSTYVMTRHLRAMKGSDASNIYDEEVADDEIDYSDDEAEAEAKRRAKAVRSGKTDESGNPLPSAANRANKRQKQNSNPSHSQQQQQQQQQQQRQMQRQPLPAHPPSRNGANMSGTSQSGRSSLPPKPMKGLPARPTFDLDATASPSFHNHVLSYGDADTGTNTGMGSRRPPSATLSSLPAKPVSVVATSPQIHRRQPSASSASPPQTRSGSAITGAPIAYQMPPTSYHANTTPSWYGGGQPAPKSPATPAYGAQQESTAQLGHYNPQFAAYWQQPPNQYQQNAAWYGASPYQHHVPSRPPPFTQNYQAQHQGAPSPSQPNIAHQQAYQYSQPARPAVPPQWNGYQYPAQYQGYNAPQSYTAAPSLPDATVHPTQQHPFGGYPVGNPSVTYSGYGYGPTGPKPPASDIYDPESPR